MMWLELLNPVSFPIVKNREGWNENELQVFGFWTPAGVSMYILKLKGSKSLGDSFDKPLFYNTEKSNSSITK